MDKYRISDEEKNKIKTYTPRSLPNSPSEMGMGPDAIKAFFYKYLDVFIDILNQKYNAIENSQESYEFRNIVYAKYIAPEGCLLNGEISSVATVPAGAEVNKNCTFSAEGTNKFIDDSNLSEPTKGENANSLFYQNKTNTGANEAGFIIEFKEELEIGIVQMYIWSVWKNATMKASVSIDNEKWVDAVAIKNIKNINESKETLELEKTPTVDTLCVYRFKVCGKAKYLKIVQEGGDWTDGIFAMKGIEIFAPNYEGKYQVVQKNGNVIELDTFIASSLVSEVLGYKDLAQKWAESESLIEGEEGTESAKYSAKYWADRCNYLYAYIDGKKGAEDGYAPLENFGTEEEPQLKIPSVYINQFDHKRHIKITSETQLQTLKKEGKAQGGDIAILIEKVYEVDEKGNKIDGTEQEAITKTWLYYAEYDENEEEIEGTQEWIPYGTSYSTNSGYATYANNAGNSAKINGHEIQTTSKIDYEKLVSNGAVSNNAIYIVEV